MPCSSRSVLQLLYVMLSTRKHNGFSLVSSGHEATSELVKHEHDYSTYAQGVLQVETLISYVRFEVFTAVTMKNAVFWDVSPCRSCMN
jgi:hypothetical protein